MISRKRGGGNKMIIRQNIYPCHFLNISRSDMVIVANWEADSKNRWTVPLGGGLAKFLTIGNEWIGSLVNYEGKALCYSKLFAEDDPFYTNLGGMINDECEYFGNGFVFEERIFIQNYVFDFAFAIELNFGKDLSSLIMSTSQS